VTGTAFKQVSLDPAQRAGILTQGNFLSVQANTYETHPVRRGVSVMEQLLCEDLPPPPANVPEPKQASDGVSTRQRYSEHSSNACATNCHARFDDLGFSFENYDGIGAWRTKDWGTDVNASGSVELVDGVKTTFKNALELLPQMAKSARVRDCIARQWLRYTLRRHEIDGDTPSLEAASKVFADTGYDMRELIVALTQTRAFTHRTPSNGETLP